MHSTLRTCRSTLKCTIGQHSAPSGTLSAKPTIPAWRLVRSLHRRTAGQKAREPSARSHISGAARTAGAAIGHGSGNRSATAHRRGTRRNRARLACTVHTNLTRRAAVPRIKVRASSQGKTRGASIGCHRKGPAGGAALARDTRPAAAGKNRENTLFAGSARSVGSATSTTAKAAGGTPGTSAAVVLLLLLL
jgi:hypothetical protein